MLPLAFVRGLFKLRANTPALAPLFQFPPRIGNRFDPSPIKISGAYCFVALIHPPSILPISSSFFAQFSYLFIGR